MRLAEKIEETQKERRLFMTADVIQGLEHQAQTILHSMLQDLLGDCPGLYQRSLHVAAA
jgi:hypothetical protein